MMTEDQEQQPERVTQNEIYILLALHHRPLYGQEIVKALKESGALRAPMKPGTLYPTLKALEEKGFATSSLWEKKNRGSKRKYYTLTQVGREEVQRHLLFQERLLAYVPKRKREIKVSEDGN